MQGPQQLQFLFLSEVPSLVQRGSHHRLLDPYYLATPCQQEQHLEVQELLIGQRFGPLTMALGLLV